MREVAGSTRALSTMNWIARLTRRQLYVAVSLVGFLSAAVWAAYIRAAAAGNGPVAAAADLAIMLTGSVVTQVWATRQNDFKLLVLWDVAAAIGTWVAVSLGMKL